MSSAEHVAPPSADDFRAGPQAQVDAGTRAGKPRIDSTSRELHRAVGGYPAVRGRHRMPLCCNVMRSVMGAGDRVLPQPPNGQGAALTIQFRLPRPTLT